MYVTLKPDTKQKNSLFNENRKLTFKKLLTILKPQSIVQLQKYY